MTHISSDIIFEHGFIAQVGLQFDLPETITVEGQMLQRKSEFHLCLACPEYLAKLIDPQKQPEIEAELVEEFQIFLKNSLEKYVIKDQFYFLQKGSRKTLAVMCDVPGLSTYFERMSKKYRVELPLQPWHITLFTLGLNKGIGMTSSEELSKLGDLVEVELHV